MSDTRPPDDGRPGGGEPEPPSEGEFGAGSVEVAELAEACRAYVERAVGIALDYGPDTLPLLDHYVELARRDVAERPELLPLMARVVGAYFGQVACRHLGLFWHVPSADVHTWRLYGRSAYLAVNPVGVAYEALQAGSQHEGPSSQLVVAPEERAPVDRRLLALPLVSDQEYYMLATRLEVLEIAVDALRAEMLQAGTADVEFDAGDYALQP